jgi:hypothetical protein
MTKKNYVFIDGNNLYLGAKTQRINLDYKKLRLYLMNKFHADQKLLKTPKALRPIYFTTVDYEG